MKIYFNRKPVTGPWGGGNKTLTAITSKLKDSGHNIVYDLEDEIDLIFCFDPRPNNTGVWYQHFIDYKSKNEKCKIIQRVGDIGTHGKPDLTNLVMQTSKISDFLIFPSDWARRAIGFKKKNYDIIPNRPLEEFYKNRNSNEFIGEKIKIVTHHWSTNPMKGFHIYKALGDKIKEGLKINGLECEFTYIGRYSEDNRSEGINLISPIDVIELSRELPNHHVYLTASLGEAGANHVLEAIASGLPIVYHEKGGSIPEYCLENGLEYGDNLNELIESISCIMKNYSYFKQKNQRYTKKMSDSIEDYCSIIESVLK